eukprot:CAMPEP_0185252450 /NCGR_PEP_ID=MMETSP1359-20130426/1532_1 /TAXON_ID=552665 /ORGANISM="Bigelowiella longifila, Strain CCMP242" /LENGTH=161 /DNA_ID=CAMNT_0027834613 /DNA_START=46 /DNA_END=531 /DNA_ORIENTATION=+
MASLALNIILAITALVVLIHAHYSSDSLALSFVQRGPVVSTPVMHMRAPASSRGLTPCVRRAVTDAKDLRKLNDDQILDEIAESSRELLVLRMAQSNRREVKPSDFGLHKKKIAQLKTIQREREIANGVGKRESRKMKQKAYRNMDILKRIRKFEQPADDE